MVWHIVKKDWRLLRWLVLASVALHAASSYLQLGPAAALPALLVTALSIVLLVHQDGLPGTRQDWLVRPIRRRDLLLAKITFVIVCIQLPLFVLDVVAGTAQGFGMGATIGAALARAVYMLFVFSLPVLALSALTRSLTEVAVTLAAWFAVLLAAFALPAMAGWTSPTTRTGVAWVPEAMRLLLLVAGGVAVLGVQYLKRRTLVACSLFAAAVLLSHTTQFLPWSLAFAVQQPLSAESPEVNSDANRDASGDAGTLDIAFDSGLGRYQLAPGQNVNDVPERPGFGQEDAEAASARRRAEGAVTIFLPLRIAGLPARSSLVVDRATVRLVDGDGTVRFEGRGNDLEVRLDGSTPDRVGTHHGIRIPGAIFNALKDRALRLEVDYAVTRFRLASESTLPPTGADQHLAGIGRCTTDLTRSDTAVELRCTSPGEPPSCVTTQLRHTASGRTNPEVSLCAPSYRPFPGHVLPDALSRFRGVLPFADPSGLAIYPVGGSQLAEADVLVRSYEPQEHRRERLVIPEIRLEDWLPAPASST